MAKKSREKILKELEVLNTSIPSPVSYSEDDDYDVLLEKLKDAQKQVEPLETEEETKQVSNFVKVGLGRGNDQYGYAIRELQRRVEALESK